MQNKNGIITADKQVREITSFSLIGNYKVEVTFNDGSIVEFDFSTLFKYPIFSKLQDENFFKQVILDWGTLVWNNGEIEISPDEIYCSGKLVKIA